MFYDTLNAITMEALRTNGLLPSWKDRLQFIALGPRDLLLYLVCRTYRTFILSFKFLPPRYLAWASGIRARRAFFRAVREVPAYAKFLAGRGIENGYVPETDKESYIKVFSAESRCKGGCLPGIHVMIDESSGSTGVPFNWVRGREERNQTHEFISYFTRYGFGSGPWITVNAFSMGAWATGINMGYALQMNSVVKNTGPDIAKILGTLTFFGSGYPYLIVGYPPFLKQLVDVAQRQGFPLADFRLNAMVGGEGMSEGLRDYLLRVFQKVYSGYGASDLEIGIAGETPLSVAIRRRARDDAGVRDALFGGDSRLPMLFQYNPLMHYVETNDKRELIFTITRSSILSPRIRYNIHDEGGVARFDEMSGRLAGSGVDINTLAEPLPKPVIRLPFLWIYGRRDFTISVMGANIYPEDLEQAVYADAELAGITRSFCQSLSEAPDGGVKPCFFFEVAVEPDDRLARRFSDSILKHLLKINADFREAWHEYPETMIPEIHLCRPGEGPFQQDAERIKQVRFLKFGA